jgi:hypothetical protein
LAGLVSRRRPPDASSKLSAHSVRKRSKRRPLFRRVRIGALTCVRQSSSERPANSFNAVFKDIVMQLLRECLVQFFQDFGRQRFLVHGYRSAHPKPALSLSRRASRIAQLGQSISKIPFCFFVHEENVYDSVPTRPEHILEVVG